MANCEKPKKILCMGAINMDLVMYMKKHPLPGETVTADSFSTFPGGKSGNQASAAAILGGDVRFFTKLGDDGFSKELIQSQIKNGVDMSYVIIENGGTSGIAMIRVDEKGQNSISFNGGANSLLTAKDVSETPGVFDECGILLISMEHSRETVCKAIEMAHSRGMAVILDPAPVYCDGIDFETAQMVDYVKPNETEAVILAGVSGDKEYSADEVFEALLEKGFKTPILTLADAGALTIVDGERYKVEPLKMTAVDTTAAGDVFIGSFAAALSKGIEFKKCLDFAKTAAALSVTKKGAQTSIPTLDEVNNLL